MATFKFKTGNKHIKGIIDYSYTRDKNSYKVTYKVSMQRTNPNPNDTSITDSSGTINYNVYVNNSAVESESVKFKVTKDGAKCVLVPYTETVVYKLGAFSSGSFTIGFSSTKASGSTDAFAVEKQTSDPVSVPAYATLPTLSSLDLVYNAGDNYFTFKGTIGNNGKNNTVTGCKVFYTITKDGETPSSSSPNFTISGKEKTSWVKQIPIPQKTGTQTIMARISTLASQGGVDTPQDKTQSWTVAYYSVPYPLQNLDIFYNTSRPTPNSTYTFRWQLRPEGSAGYNNSVVRYDIKIYVDNILKETVNVTRKESTEDGDTEQIMRTGKELGLKKGSKLKFSGRAIGSSAYNNTPSSSRYSSEIPIESAGIAKIKTSDDWKEGQVWIKTKEKWVRSTGVYVKTSNGWKQSL